MMKSSVSNALSWWCGAVGIAFSCNSYSAIVENITLGNAKALALGNAVTADPPGIDSIHFNPAGLAELDGRQMNLKLLVAAMEFEVEFGGHDTKTQQALEDYGYEDEAAYSSSKTSTIGVKLPFSDGVTEWPLPVLVMPFGGASYSPPDTNVTYATAVYAPMAAGYIRESDDPGRFMGEELSLVKITYFSPSFAFELTDTWSIGASVGLSWQGAGVKLPLRVPNSVLVFADTLVNLFQNQGICPDANDPAPLLDLCGGAVGPYSTIFDLEVDAEDAMVWNINVGALWKPTPWFTWGFVYQAESVGSLEGSYRLEYGDEWVGFFGDLNQSGAGSIVNAVIPFPTGLKNSPAGEGVETGDVTMEVIMPAHFSTGVSVQVTPAWKINFDLKWTDWAAWEGLELEFDKQLDFLKLASLLSPHAELDTLTIPRNYESVWNWALGVEYQYNNNLALRFGYEPRKSSIPDHKQDVLLPLGDAELFGFGFEYRLGTNQVLEAGMGYLRANADVPAGSSTNANSSDQANNIIYNPYAGTDFSSQVQGFLFELSYTSEF